MRMGPVWDMDLTLGCTTIIEDSDGELLYDTPEGWKIRDGGLYRELFAKEEFRQAVSDEYYNGGVRQALMDGVAVFEQEMEETGSDGYLNYSLFGHSDHMNLIEHGDTYDEYCRNMIAFYKARIEWIDGQMSR